MSASVLPISTDTCTIRGTHQLEGRHEFLSPDKGAVKHLHYGRIRLSAEDAPIEFGNGSSETGLICLAGSAVVRVGTESFALGVYDSLYIPRDSRIEVSADSLACDLAEISAPIEKTYPLQFVRYSDVKSNAGLHFKTGAPSFERTVNILIGKNVEAGRILAGVTFSQPGNWTSWPPHEHAEILEEAYVYIAMPAPAWGMQFVYTDPKQPELVQIVREGDCIVMPKGYHPNVAAPGGTINFLWIMAAHREEVDRQFGVVNVQPEYATGGSGLDAGRAEK
jgi:5-deoxy-glucuronate isomerase